MMIQGSWDLKNLGNREGSVKPHTVPARRALGAWGSRISRCLVLLRVQVNMLRNTGIIYNMFSDLARSWYMTSPTPRAQGSRVLDPEGPGSQRGPIRGDIIYGSSVRPLKGTMIYGSYTRPWIRNTRYGSHIRPSTRTAKRRSSVRSSPRTAIYMDPLQRPL